MKLIGSVIFFNIHDIIKIAFWSVKCTQVTCNLTLSIVRTEGFLNAAKEDTIYERGAVLNKTIAWLFSKNKGSANCKAILHRFLFMAFTFKLKNFVLNTGDENVYVALCIMCTCQL